MICKIDDDDDDDIVGLFLPSNISESVLLFQVGREILDKNFKIRGFQQKSELQVVPLTDM